MTKTTKAKNPVGKTKYETATPITAPLDISELKKEVKKIKKLIDNADVNEAGLASASTKAMLASTYQVVMEAYEQYLAKPTQTYAYAYSNLVTQYRELLHDMRAIQTSEQQLAHIRDSIVRPNIMLLVQNLSIELHSLKRKINTLTRKPELRRSLKASAHELFKGHGQYLQEVLNKINHDLEKYLLEKK